MEVGRKTLLTWLLESTIALKRKMTSTGRSVDRTGLSVSPLNRYPPSSQLANVTRADPNCQQSKTFALLFRKFFHRHLVLVTSTWQLATPVDFLATLCMHVALTLGQNVTWASGREFRVQSFCDHPLVTRPCAGPIS
jgi:hypothetical protein